ncbi:MAG: tetratricopeptide repeat protein [Xanthobacteraceae bacterium]
MSSSPQPSATAEPSSPCACGSGLRSDRCCAFDWSTPAAEPQPTPEIDRARTALAAGNLAEAAGLLIDLLERFPRHLDALRLLYQLRNAENKVAAAEALLNRIVRLDPNDLAATQALAMLLFGKGALAEAEIHARNAVRRAPDDVQSHNLMGMIMTQAQRPQVGEYHVSAQWQHAFGDVTPTVAVSFQSTGAGFSTAGLPIAADAAVTEAGIDWRITPRMKFGIAYQGQLAQNAQTHAGTATFTWNF